MATEGYKKKDIQRVIQKGNGVSISSSELDSTNTIERLEIGFPAEKVTLVTTGDLVVTATPQIGDKNSHAGIVANTTPSTTTTNNMFTALNIVWTSGTGKLLVLAK